MTNTRKSFEDKWSKNKTLAFSETLRENSDFFLWILHRNGFKDGDDLRRYLKNKKRILDAGCGNGRVTALLRKYSDEESTQITGIDLVSSDIARDNLAGMLNVTFLKRDLLEDLRDLGQFDFVYCQEVLHHTQNPRQAFLNLCGLLTEEGEIAVYVYKRKAPVREFVDDFIREEISSLPYEQAMTVCHSITQIGKVLSEIKVDVEVPDVEVLEIQAGVYDLQRFVYHFFMKCFWNPELSFEDNAVINYDWYHPQLCSRHTIDEVKEWFEAAGLKVVHEHIDFYGITVRGRSTN